MIFTSIGRQRTRSQLQFNPQKHIQQVLLNYPSTGRKRRRRRRNVYKAGSSESYQYSLWLWRVIGGRVGGGDCAGHVYVLFDWEWPFHPPPHIHTSCWFELNQPTCHIHIIYTFMRFSVFFYSWFFALNGLVLKPLQSAIIENEPSPVLVAHLLKRMRFGFTKSWTRAKRPVTMTTLES